MENNKKSKVKNWLSKNKEILVDVGRIAVTGGAIVTAYIVGDKVATLRMSAGLKSFHEAGIVKFFDPDVNKEVSVEEATGVIKRTFFNK